MSTDIRNYEDLPVILQVDDVAAVLGISRKTAYNLTKQNGFPVARVGKKRLVIPRDRFLKWLDESADKPLG